MKTKSRNLFLLILTFVMAISCMGLVGGIVYAEPQEVTPKFEMLGASIRLDEPTGIRFAAKVDGEKYSQVISGEDTLFGAIIVPKDILGDITISKDNNHVTALAGKTYLDSIKNYSQGLLGKVEKDAQDNPTGYYTINYSISNVKYGNYNREFFGLVYIRSGVEGSYTYEYATIENVVNERTVADVAKAYYPIAEDADTTVLENFIYKAEFLANDTESGDYQTSETNASAYIIEQKAKIEEFNNVATATVANQLSINAAMEKYNALGDFAKTVAEGKAVVDEKQAEVCGDIKNAISALAEKTTYVESDYHKIYGLKSSYTALPEESKELVDNYSDLVDVENKFLKNYDVQVVFGATEEENGVGKIGQSNTPTLSYGGDNVYGPTIKISNVGGAQRISAVVTKNYNVDYSGCKLYFNFITTSDAYLQYVKASNHEWTTITDVIFYANIWDSISLAPSEFSTYNSGRNVGFNISQNGNFMMSAVFAIRLSEVGQINAKIAELNNKETLEPSDYHVIYGLKTNYELLSAEVQAKVDYDVLLGIETKFLESYDVQVVYDASESAPQTVGTSYDSSKPLLYWETDETYGSFLRIYNQGAKQAQTVTLTGGATYSSEYDIYFNVKSNNDIAFRVLGDKTFNWGWMSTTHSITANEWTQFKIEGGTGFGYSPMWFGSSSLPVKGEILVSAIFAIKAK